MMDVDMNEIWRALEQFGTVEPTTSDESGAFVPSNDVTRAICYSLASLLKQCHGHQKPADPVRHITMKLREYNDCAKQKRRKAAALRILALTLFEMKHLLGDIETRFADPDQPKLPGLHSFPNIFPEIKAKAAEPEQQVGHRVWRE